MKKITLFLCLFLTLISHAEVQLFNNPLFSNFVKIQEKSLVGFRKAGITIDDGTYCPAG